MASDSKETDGDTSNIATTLGVINGAYLFKIPPKASSMGHMADTWPKKAMWVGRLKILSTATECTLQFEDIDTDKIYLKVLINNDPNKPTTVEPCADSSRYFALNVSKPGTEQILTLGLGFQTRDESMDFKMATGEFARMQQNLEEAKKLNEKMKSKEDFSLGADEVLVMKPMHKKKKKKKQEEETKTNDDGGDGGGFLPPPSDQTSANKKKSKKKKKKKKKEKTAENAKEEKLFGDFENANDGDDGSWATFD